LGAIALHRLPHIQMNGEEGRRGGDNVHEEIMEKPLPPKFMTALCIVNHL
jgi:hypothetical protein